METIDEDHCKCPKCGTEVWYEYETEPNQDEMKEFMQPRHLLPTSSGPEFSILSGPVIPGSGSKSKGNSSRKLLMKKKTTGEIYRKLINSPNPKPKKAAEKLKKSVDTKANPVI